MYTVPVRGADVDCNAMTPDTSLHPFEHPELHAWVLKGVQELSADIAVSDVIGNRVTVNTGRYFHDGDPLRVSLWVAKNPYKTSITVSDNGTTFSRVGASNTPDYALSVRNEIIKELPVQSIMGQVILYTPPDRIGEGINMLADACLVLDAATIVARHMRPKR